jgi:hypothetical protein
VPHLSPLSSDPNDDKIAELQHRIMRYETLEAERQNPDSSASSTTATSVPTHAFTSPTFQIAAGAVVHIYNK